MPKSALKDENYFSITVSTGMASRIADMNRQHQEWKLFYNVNMVARRESRSLRLDCSAYLCSRPG